MTEAEWMTCRDRQPMMEEFRGKLSDRKLRLFACACCRIENFADGFASTSEMEEAHEQSYLAAADSNGEAAWWATHPDTWYAAFDAAYASAGREAILGWPGRNDDNEEKFLKEHAECTRILRDIFGNPFRPVAFNTSWRSSTLLVLATGIYVERAFERLPILADALQDEGCDNEEFPIHLRQGREHCRGCWALDLVLGKEKETAEKSKPSFQISS